MKIQMPKACVSCIHYSAAGYKEDSQSPIPRDYRSASKRDQFGSCALHAKAVYFTEICGAFKGDDLIEVVAISNRAEPMNPHQEVLAL